MCFSWRSANWSPMQRAAVNQITMWRETRQTLIARCRTVNKSFNHICTRQLTSSVVLVLSSVSQRCVRHVATSFNYCLYLWIITTVFSLYVFFVVQFWYQSSYSFVFFVLLNFFRVWLVRFVHIFVVCLCIYLITLCTVMYTVISSVEHRVVDLL